MNFKCFKKNNQRSQFECIEPMIYQCYIYITYIILNQPQGFHEHYETLLCTQHHIEHIFMFFALSLFDWEASMNVFVTASRQMERWNSTSYRCHSRICGFRVKSPFNQSILRVCVWWLDSDTETVLKPHVECLDDLNFPALMVRSWFFHGESHVWWLSSGEWRERAIKGAFGV